jgi:hypothetical protein
MKIFSFFLTACTFFICLNATMAQPSTTTLNFGEVFVGATNNQTTIISNSTGSSRIYSAVLPAGFRATPAFPISIANGSSETITISFMPVADNNYSSSFSIIDDQLIPVSTLMSVNGIGVALPIFSATSIDFGVVPATGERSTNFNINNVSSKDLIITWQVFSPPFSRHSNEVPMQNTYPLWAGWNSNPEIRFNPLVSGTVYSQTITINYSTAGGANGIFTLNLLGTGGAVLQCPQLISPVNNKSGIDASENLNLVWNSISGANLYQIQVQRVTTGSYEVNATTSSTTFSAGVILLPGEVYRWRVRASTNGGSSWGIWSDIQAFITEYLISPKNLSVGISIAPVFDWADVVGATSYKLEIAADFEFNNLVLVKAGIANSMYTLNQPQALLNGVTYYWRVISNNVVQVQSGIWSFITLTPAVPYLTNPANGAILSGGATIFTWYSGMNVRYVFQWSSSTTFDPTVAPIIEDSTTNTNYVLNNSVFNTGSTYYWRVISKTIEVYPAHSRIINFSNIWQFGMPGLPQLIALSPAGNGTIYINPPTLYWMSLGYNPKVNQYIIRYRRNGSGWLNPVYTQDQLNNTNGIFSSTNTNCFVNIPHYLDSGYKYEWQAAAWDGLTTLNDASYSTGENFTVYGNVFFLTCYPTYPVGGSTIYSSTPSLYWVTNVYSPVIYYQVRYAKTTNDLFNNYNQLIVHSNSVTLPRLSAGTYYWQVAGSFDSSNWGFFSTPASFVVNSSVASATVPTPASTSPISGAITNVTNPTLTWIAYSTDPLQYKVTWSTNPAISSLTGTFISNTGTTGWLSSTSFVLGGLTNGATYYWQVKARLSTTQTEGDWSTVAWFTISAGASSVVPIAGSPINGTPINNSSATLSWVLPTISSSTLKYDVQLSKKADFNSELITVSNLEKANVEVTNLDGNTEYFWRVASKTPAGIVSGYSAPTSFNTGTSIVGIEKNETLPTEFRLYQNYPNPFNPTTIIKYSISEANLYSGKGDGRGVLVTLKVYDLLGREVATLVNEPMQPGSYTAQFSSINSHISSGIYFYTLKAGSFVETKKMLLIK